MKVTCTCDMCGKQFSKYPSQIKGKKHLFCSRKCLADFANKTINPERYDELKDMSKLGKNLPELNRLLKPIRMTAETRSKIRATRLNSGEGKTYSKTYGRHTHKVVAEKILGRPLKPGEVVHHINKDKRDNRPENLMIFASQSEHAKWHAEHDKGGEAR